MGHVDVLTVTCEGAIMHGTLGRDAAKGLDAPSLAEMARGAFAETRAWIGANCEVTAERSVYLFLAQPIGAAEAHTCAHCLGSGAEARERLAAIIAAHGIRGSPGQLIDKLAEKDAMLRGGHLFIGVVARRDGPADIEIGAFDARGRRPT